MSNKETKITPVQAAIKFWTERYKEAKEAGATKTMEAADLFLQYLEIILKQEQQFMSEIWDAARMVDEYGNWEHGKQQFFSQYENNES